MSIAPTSSLKIFDTGLTGTPISAPLTIDDVDAHKWDESCDVLVLGCGLAGATTALKAAEDGRFSVIIADRFDGGGASQASGGVLYLGGGTSAQTEAGVVDSVEAMINYLTYETGNVVGRATVEQFCRESASFIPWLAQHGVRFGGPFTDAKTSYPSDYFLYYSGNERVTQCATVTQPAPRGHRAKPMDGSNNGSSMSGSDLMIPLKQALDQARNVQFRRRTAARRLVTDRTGAVVGAELWQIPVGSIAEKLHTRMNALTANMIVAILGLSAPVSRLLVGIERSSARPRLVRARKAVVIATGGFVYNHQMLAERAPVYHKVMPLGTIGDDGSGIMMGESVGGATGSMDRVSPWRFLYPPASWTKGIVCSTNGQRIVNEEAYGARVGEALFEQSGGRGWLIIDRQLFETSKQEAADPKLLPFQKYLLKGAFARYAKTAGSVNALAAKIQVSPEVLAETVRRYNEDIATGRTDAFGKSDKARHPISMAPFTAFDISYYTKFFPMTGITVGGLCVDETTSAVLNAQNRAIPGLYAVGRSAVGLPSNHYVSGMSLADCVWSGWRAARAISTRA
jgi:3-oxo-5alpha-steroid 4-dehydrogenase